MFTRSHPIHSEPHQHFSPNTITIVACGKTSPITQIQHSHCASPRTRHSFRWWSPSGSCFCQWENLSWFYTHFSASRICFLWSWEETVSLNCIWLLQVISLKPSAGLLGPGDFFLAAFCISEKDGFIRLSVKMCFMRMDEALYPSQDIYYISYASEMQSKYNCLHIIWIVFMKH